MCDDINGLHPMRPARPIACLARFLSTIAVAMTLLAAGLPTSRALAQSPFAAALYVNDSAITNYEITQKMKFLEFIGVTSADPRQLAIERLIEDRLQLQEGTRLGGRVTPDQLDSGLQEFAARAELTAEEMFERMDQAGIDRETFVSFIRSGIMWRELIRALYSPQVNITESMIDQALSVEGVQPVTEVLMSEIFLPTDPQYAEAVQRIVPQIQRIRSETEFANAARQVSAAPTATAGGRIDRWVNVAAMPAPVARAMENAGIGAVVGPIEVPGALAFFQLRARRNSRSVPDSAIELAYHRTGLSGGRSGENTALVEQFQAQIDSCVDYPATLLRAVPQLTDADVAEITRPQADVDANTRAELERLNPGQISANLVENNQLVVLMLCRRSVSNESVPSRETVRMALLNRALEGHSMLYLQRLRADAEIRYP